MTTLILLSGGDAASVRGPSATVDGAALEPIALTDGRFILSVAVLDDIAHTPHRPLLAGLPTVEATEVAALLPAVDP